MTLSFNQGHSPQESCELVVKEAQQKAKTTTKPFEMALIAINRKVNTVVTIVTMVQFLAIKYKAKKKIINK